MHYQIEGMRSKTALDLVWVTQIPNDQLCRAASIGVPAREVVKHKHFVAGIMQRQHHVRADITGATDDKNRLWGSHTGHTGHTDRTDRADWGIGHRVCSGGRCVSGQSMLR